MNNIDEYLEKGRVEWGRLSRIHSDLIESAYCVRQWELISSLLDHLLHVVVLLRSRESPGCDIQVGGKVQPRYQLNWYPTKVLIYF
jgi:hypothetical protein